MATIPSKSDFHSGSTPPPFAPPDEVPTSPVLFTSTVPPASAPTPRNARHGSSASPLRSDGTVSTGTNLTKSDKASDVDRHEHGEDHLAASRSITHASRSNSGLLAGLPPPQGEGKSSAASHTSASSPPVSPELSDSEWEKVKLSDDEHDGAHTGKPSLVISTAIAHHNAEGVGQLAQFTPQKMLEMLLRMDSNTSRTASDTAVLKDATAKLQVDFDRAMADLKARFDQQATLLQQHSDASKLQSEQLTKQAEAIASLQTMLEKAHAELGAAQTKLATLGTATAKPDPSSETERLALKAQIDAQNKLINDLRNTMNDLANSHRTLKYYLMGGAMAVGALGFALIIAPASTVGAVAAVGAAAVSTAGRTLTHT